MKTKFWSSTWLKGLILLTGALLALALRPSLLNFSSLDYQTSSMPFLYAITPIPFGLLPLLTFAAIALVAYKLIVSLRPV